MVKGGLLGVSLSAMETNLGWKVASLVLPTEVVILVSSQFTSCTLEVEVLSCVLHIITIISTAI